MKKVTVFKQGLTIALFILFLLSGNEKAFTQIIQTFPHIEDFEISVPPPNWTQSVLVSGTTTPVWSMVNTGTNPPASPLANLNMAQFNSHSASTGSRARLITPAIFLTGIVHPQLTFNMYHDALSAIADSLTIEVSPDRTNWTRLNSYLRYAATTGWTPEAYVINLTAYTNQTIYISFTGTSRTGNNIYIDYVVIEPGPTCPAPGNLSANSITTSQANLIWVAGASETRWQVEWGQGGFTQGTGTLSYTNTPSKLLSSLSAATVYSYYVRAVCGSGDTSTWAGPYSFRTLCGAVSPDVTPWTEGFESGYTDTQINWPCYTDDIMTGSANWTANNSQTLYNRAPRTGTWNAFIRYSADNWLYKQFTLTGGRTYDFSMYARQYTATPSYVTFKVKYGLSDTSTAMVNSIIDSTSVTSGNYQRLFGRLTPTATGVYYIGIYCKTASSTNYVSIDDLSLRTSPSCPEPYNLIASNVLNSSALLNWVRWSTHSNVKFKVAGSPSVTIRHNVTSPYTLNGLSPNTDYVVWVQDSCGSGNMSIWCDSITFRTAQTPITLPYTMDFERGSAAWVLENGTQTNKWVVGTATACNSDTSLYISNDNGISNAYNINLSSTVHFYHDVLFTAGAPAYTLSFDWKAYGESCCDYLRVYIVDPSTTPVAGTMLSTGQIGLSNYYLQTTWQHNSIQLPGTYAGTIKRLVFSWRNDGSIGTPPPGAIDNISLSILTCPLPVSLSAYNIGTNSAYLTWAAAGVRWQIEWGPQGFTQGTGTRVWSANDTFNLTGLNAITNYGYYVRAVCGPGDTTAWAGPLNFTTLCDVYNAPFEEHFNTTTKPSCWNISGPQSWLFTNSWPQYGALPIANTDHTNIGGSFAGVDGNGTAGITGITLSTPLINIAPLTNPRLRFWLFNNNTNSADYQTLRVDMWNGSIWINNIYYYGPTENNSNWQEKIINLSSYTITGPVRFNFVVDKSNVSPYYDDIAIDDVFVESTPTCQYPANPSAYNILAHTAILFWTAGGSETKWQIEWGARGFSHGNGTRVISYNDTFNLSGLNSVTNYSYYVRSICTPGDTSLWTGPFNFTTSCDVYPAPFEEHFNTTTIPACWTMSGPQTWLFTNTWPQYGASTISGTDHTGTGGSFAGVDGNGTVGITGITLTSPYIDISSLSTPRLRFWLFNNNTNSTDYQTLRVDMWNGSSWINSIFYYGPTENSSSWQEKIISLSSYTITGPVKFNFVVDKSTGTPYYDDMVIDDVYLENTPTCQYPSTPRAINIAATNAYLTWLPGGSETQWQIEWGPRNFVHGTGTYATSYNDTFNLTGLLPGTAYTYYVRSICNPGDTSTWALPVNFSTSLIPVNVPFTLNFEQGAGTWQIVNGTQTNKWYVGTATANNSANSIYISNDNGVSNAYNSTITSVVHFYNDIAFPSGGNPFILNFDWKAYGESCCDYLKVFLVDPSVTPVAGTNLTTGQLGSNLNLQTTWQNAVIQLPSTYSGTIKRLVFTWYNDGSVGTPPPGAIDNISISVYTCPPPTSLAAFNITPVSADLRWTSGAYATQWQIEWGLQSFTHGQGNFIISPNDTFTLSSLAPSTSYKYYVRGICSPGDSSIWAGPFSFTTQCVAVTNLPYVQNFESGAIPLCWSNTVVNAGTGTAPAWSVVTVGSNPGCTPVSGADMAKFNSYNAAAGASARLESGYFTFSNLHYGELSFSMYHDNTSAYLAKKDSVAVQINTGSVWTTLAGYLRPQPSSQWTRHTIRLDAFLAQTFRIGFLGVSTLGYNIYIDSVFIRCLPDTASITVTPGCVTGSVTVHSTYNNDQTFYLRNQTGNPVSEWSGNASSHIFTALPSAMYSGQVGVSCISALSPVVALNNYNHPTVYYSPPQSQDSVCLWDTPFTLQGGYGMPGGGTGYYSGAGVSNNIFTPSNAGGGPHQITYTYTYNGCAGDTFAIITVINCPGINEIENNFIRIFPNPTDSRLNIDFTELPENTKICILDMHGQLIYREILQPSGKIIHREINMANNPKGIYIIQIVNDKGLFLKKVVLN